MVMQLFEKNAEAKLVEALNSVNDPSGWNAVHFHLGDLMEQFKSEYQVRIAVNLISDLLKNFDGGIFVLADLSIIVVCYGLEKTLQNKLIFQLRYLYMEDPLAYDEQGQESASFYTAYDLKEQWQDFLELSTRRMALSTRKVGSARAEKIVAAMIEKRAPAPEIPEKKGEFSASRLANLERELQHVGIGKVIRRQPVCAAQAGLPVRKVFDELYVHMAQLREVMKADVDFVSNRWLFRYLTQLLDARMLDYLRSEHDQYLASAVSININTETLLSEKFQQFDQALPAAGKAGIVLEVPVVDAFVDMAGFNIARKEMQKLGYRICLDGVTPDSFNHIQREKLGVDLIKVQWNPAQLSEIDSPQRRDMAEAVRATNPSRVILCRCDNKQAIDFGQSIGIALFQGRYIDLLVNPSGEVKN